MAEQYRGIDVSTFQGLIDWNQVKNAGIQFAMVRAGYGWEDPERQIDAQFENNMRGTAAAGIPAGAYHYSYATTPEEARKEASFFLNIIKGHRLEYPVAMDVEDPSQRGLSRDTLTEVVMAFCTAVEEAGYYTMIYTSLDWAVNRLDMDALSRFDFWLAQWNSQPTYNGNFGMWQYSNSGSVAGIFTRVDLDLSYRDYAAIIRDGGLNHLNDPEPEPNPAFQVGDTVRVRPGVTTFADGTGMASFVRDALLYVRQVAGDRVLVSTMPEGSDYTGWVLAGDLVAADGGGTPAPVLRVGAQVRYSGRLYATSDGGGPGLTVYGTYTVSRILPDKKAGVLLNNGLGWVPENAVTVVG